MTLQALSGRPKDKFIQLALERAKVKWDKVKWPQLISEKIDGVFCVAHKDAYLNQVRIYSRTGELYTSMRHIEEILYNILDYGELIIFEAAGPYGTPQPFVSGWCRDTKAQHPELVACCHDLLNIEEFLGASDERPYTERLDQLNKRVHHLMRTKKEADTISILQQSFVNSLEDALKFTELIWSRDGEGAVLRNPQAPYSPGKRNQDIIKIKKGVSFDLEVVDLYEGEGKYKGNLGGIICRWKDGKELRLSGMTDAQRLWWWDDPKMIIGQIVQVDAMCESSKGLLREPRFKGIRHDKTKGDF